MEIDYVAIGKRIKEKRLSLKLTQQKLSEMSGTEPSNISHIERGATKLSLPTLLKIANALDTTVDELLCDNMYRAREIFVDKIAIQIKDCDDEEIKIISDVVRALKDSLKYRKHFNENK